MSTGRRLTLAHPSRSVPSPSGFLSTLPTSPPPGFSAYIHFWRPPSIYFFSSFSLPLLLSRIYSSLTSRPPVNSLSRSRQAHLAPARLLSAAPRQSLIRRLLHPSTSHQSIFRGSVALVLSLQGLHSLNIGPLIPTSLHLFSSSSSLVVDTSQSPLPSSQPSPWHPSQPPHQPKSPN